MNLGKKYLQALNIPFHLSDIIYRIVASTNTCYYSENQLFVKRSQYIRTENPLHKQSDKGQDMSLTETCFYSQLYGMAVRVVEFSNRVYKFRKIFA